MIAYGDNDTADARVQAERLGRYQHLMEAAKRLDDQAADLKRQADEYRELARRINPTSS